MTSKGIVRDSYTISLIEDGVPKFSNNPIHYLNEGDAIAECVRLAQANPGKKYAYFCCCGIVVAGGAIWS